MLPYLVALASFVAYLVLLTTVRTSRFSKLLIKSIFCLAYWFAFWVLTFAATTLTNFAFFGDFLSPLEQKVIWVPILRAPLVEESTKLVSIYILKRTQKVSGNELVRLGGSIGNWVFFLENISYIQTQNISWQVALFRLFPLHISLAFLDAFGLRDDFPKKRVVLPLLAMFLHGLSNYLSIYFFQLYVVFGFAVSLSLFFSILLLTPVRARTPLSLLTKIRVS